MSNDNRFAALKAQLRSHETAHGTRFAQRLTEARIVWQYEPHALLLSDGRIYLPDFFVEAWQAYIEIKGWHGWRTMEKYELAVKDGHRVRLVTDPGIAIEELAQLAAL